MFCVSLLSVFRTRVTCAHGLFSGDLLRRPLINVGFYLSCVCKSCVCFLLGNLLWSHKDTQTHRHTQNCRDNQTSTQTHTHTYTDTYPDWHKHRYWYRHNHKHRYIHRHRLSHSLSHSLRYRHRHRSTDPQRYRETHRGIQHRFFFPCVAIIWSWATIKKW